MATTCWWFAPFRRSRSLLSSPRAAQEPNCKRYFDFCCWKTRLCKLIRIKNDVRPSYQVRGSSGQSREKQRHLLQRDWRYYSCEHFWLIAMILEWGRWGTGAIALGLYRLHSHSFGPGPFLGHHAPREQRYKKGSPNYPPPWKGSACERVCIQDLCAVCPPLQPCGGPMLPISPSLPADEIEYEKKLFFKYCQLIWNHILLQTDFLTFFLSPLFAPAAFMPSSIFSKTRGTPTNLNMNMLKISRKPRKW